MSKILVTGAAGFIGSQLAHVPVDSMSVTEDVHMMFDHLMMSVLRQALCGGGSLKKR